MTKCIYWTGTVKNLRFDMINTIGEFYIKTFEFLSPNNSEAYVINVDGNDFQFYKGEYKLENDEVFVAANPSKGFYNVNNFYYEWDRRSGNLYIKTRNKTEFEFTVGSDVAYVNGIEETLPEPIELFDGLVMLPIKFIYDRCSYEYTQQDKLITACIRGEDYINAIESMVVNEFEFNIDGNREGWNVNAASGAVYNGCYVVTSSVTANGNFDPQLTNKQLNIDADEYTRVEIRVKPEFHETVKNPAAKIYFTTSVSSDEDEIKAGTVYYYESPVDEEGFYLLNFDFSQDEDWIKTIKSFRFDPDSSNGTFMIDYIRVFKNQYEFNEENQGWNTYASSGSVSDGYYVISTTENSSGTYNPHISIRELNVDAKVYNKVEVRYKPQFTDETTGSKNPCIYYTTSSDTIADETKKIRFNFSDLTADDEGFYTFVADFSNDQNWKDTIITLRLDPSECHGVYIIDYVRFSK